MVVRTIIARAFITRIIIVIIIIIIMIIIMIIIIIIRIDLRRAAEIFFHGRRSNGSQVCEKHTTC
jgi:hypothetical protein